MAADAIKGLMMYFKYISGENISSSNNPLARHSDHTERQETWFQFIQVLHFIKKMSTTTLSHRAVITNGGPNQELRLSTVEWVDGERDSKSNIRRSDT